MISALLGKPGAGKSFQAVRLVVEAVRVGRPVVTNLPLKLEAAFWKEHAHLLHMVKPWEPGEGGKGRVYAFSRLEHWEAAVLEPVEVEGERTGPLVVVDECQHAFAMFLARGSKAAEEAAHVEGFLATHRHHLMDVVLLAQNHTQFPVAYKHLVEQWRETVGTKEHGVPGFAYSTYQTWTGHRESIKSGWNRYDPKIFELYDSHALGGGAGGKGTGVATRFNRVVPIWLRWQVLFAAGTVVFLVWGIWSFFSSFDGVGVETATGFGGGGAEGEPGEMSPAGVAGEDERTGDYWPDGTPRFRPPPRGTVGPGEFGEPDVAWLPSVEMAVLGVVGGGVVWADGTTLTLEQLAGAGILVEEHAICEVVLSGPEWRRVWRCLVPGG